jgi:ribosomal protein S18 acetylase RimI-like enzyme
VRPEDLEEVRSLLAAHGWSDRVADRSRFAAVVRWSERALVAEEDGKIVAFGRVVTDGVWNGYLSMVIVDPEYRHRGIGTALVEELMGPGTGITWLLRARDPDSVPFWEKLGFRHSEITMERLRET